MSGLFKKNKGTSSEFQFSDSPDTACFSCKHVVSEGAPILSVTHDHDGSYQFLCGQEHKEEDAKIISLKEATVLDPTLNQLYNMPIGVGADRETKDGDWTPYKLADE
jgi:hypothetical protein